MQLAKFHYQVLDYLEQNPYTLGQELKDLFPDDQIRIERTLNLLYDQKLLFCTVATDNETFVQNRSFETHSMEQFGFDPIWRFCLTEAGHVALESHKQEMESFSIQQQELKVAKEDSIIAKSAAFHSKVVSYIAVIISLIVLIHDCFFN